MIFRVTQKFAKKIGVAPTRCLPLHRNPFADWTAHLFIADRVQYVLLTNTASLYSMVMRGRGISDPNQFLKRAVSQMRQDMCKQEDGDLFQRFIEPKSREVSFSKTGDRRVTGSMNDLIRMAKFHLVEGQDTLFDTSVGLNETPMSCLGHANPKEAFHSLDIEEEEELTKHIHGGTHSEASPDALEQGIPDSRLPQASGMAFDGQNMRRRSLDEFEWSKLEKKIARAAFAKAQEREFSDFAEQIRSEADKISGPDDIWAFYGLMSERLREIDEKYDYRYSVLIRVFARLMKDGWLNLGDLEGFADEKIDRIQSLISAWNDMSKLDRS